MVQQPVDHDHDLEQQEQLFNQQQEQPSSTLLPNNNNLSSPYNLFIARFLQADAAPAEEESGGVDWEFVAKIAAIILASITCIILFVCIKLIVN